MTPSRLQSPLRVGLFVWLAVVSVAPAQYVGYVYPAGGEQGTTFEVTLGGQKLEGVHGATVSGTGVKARLVEYRKKMNPMEIKLLNEQVKELKEYPPGKKNQAITNLMARIEKLVGENTAQPACASIAAANGCLFIRTATKLTCLAK